MKMDEFVDGWTIAQTLGEGAFGEVKLLINRNTGDTVAMKIIDLEKHPDARTSIRKEVVIHRMLTDPHIIRYFGQRQEGSTEYIFLEYAAGGELFDKIEPDIGMPPREAQKYFIQLLAGVEYLHSRGVAHRDLKPENLLLDEHDNLKITDFGLATMYRIQGRERLLDKRCGTLPYVAPEVLARSYNAEPADVWSCGIILVAMLAGELPWDQPTVDCMEYAAWKDNKYVQITPWSKLDSIVLSLIRKIMVPAPSARYTIANIKAHCWCRKRFSGHFGARIMESPDGSRAKRVCSGVNISPPDCAQDGSRISHSQPEPHDCQGSMEPAGVELNGVPFSFSQPAALDDLLLNSQFNCTQTSTQSGQPTYQKLVKRMTRFFVKVSCEEISKQLCTVLEKNACSWKIHTANVITITSQDRRKMVVVFKAMILDMDGQTLLDFRLSKGCGLEFKRKFVKIKECLGEVVLKGPVMWPIAKATHTLP